MIEIANLVQAVSGPTQQVAIVQDGSFQYSEDGEPLDFQDIMGEVAKPSRDEKEVETFAVAPSAAPLSMAMPLMVSTSLGQAQNESEQAINAEIKSAQITDTQTQLTQNFELQNENLKTINPQSAAMQNGELQDVNAQKIAPFTLNTSSLNDSGSEVTSLFAKAQASEVSALIPEKEVMKSAAHPVQPPTIFKGIMGEVRVAQANSGEFASSEWGLSIPEDGNDARVVQTVTSDSTTQDINIYDALTSEAQQTVTNDETLTVIQNDAGDAELTPYQAVAPEDNGVNVGDHASGETTGPLDSQDASIEGFASHSQNKEKGTSSFAESKENQVSVVNSTTGETGIAVGDTKSGNPTFISTIRQEVSVEKPEVIDQVYAKMNFPSLKESGEQKISIALDPQELGRIDVELKMEGDKVNAIFKADHQALTFARNDADKLAQMLKDQGFNASAHDFQFQERTPQESRYAQAEKTYDAGFSLEEGGVDAPTVKGSLNRYNVGISGRSYDVVI